MSGVRTTRWAGMRLSVWLSGGRLSGGRLSGRLSGGRLSGGRLSGGRLSGGRLSGGRLSGGRLSGGRLSGGRAVPDIGVCEHGDSGRDAKDDHGRDPGDRAALAALRGGFPEPVRVGVS